MFSALGSLRFWTFFTSTFYENRIISLVFTVLAILVVGKWISNNKWSNREFIYFILYVAFLTPVSTFFVVIILGRITGSLRLFRTEMNGFTPVLSAFTMIARLEIPDTQISFFSFPLAGKHLTYAMILISFIFTVLFNNLTPLLFTLFGSYYGWLYIRFYLKKENVIGISNDEFSFSSFFPESLQKIINPVSNSFYYIFSYILNFRHDKTTTTLPLTNVLTSGNTIGQAPKQQLIAEEVKRRIETGNKEIDALLSKVEKEETIIEIKE